MAGKSVCVGCHQLKCRGECMRAVKFHGDEQTESKASPNPSAEARGAAEKIFALFSNASYFSTRNAEHRNQMLEGWAAIIADSYADILRERDGFSAAVEALNEQIRGYKAEIEELVAVALEGKLTIQASGHLTSCRFTGCSCGSTDEFIEGRLNFYRTLHKSPLAEADQLHRSKGRWGNELAILSIRLSKTDEVRSPIQLALCPALLSRRRYAAVVSLVRTQSDSQTRQLQRRIERKIWGGGTQCRIASERKS